MEHIWTTQEKKNTKHILITQLNAMSFFYNLFFANKQTSKKNWHESILLQNIIIKRTHKPSMGMEF